MSEQADPPLAEAVKTRLLDNETTEPAEAQGDTATEAPEGVTATEADILVHGDNLSSATDSEPKDTHMSDAPAPDLPESSALSSTAPGAATASSVTAANSSSNAPSPTPVPARVGTPLRNTTANANGASLEGERTTSRATSVIPDAGPTIMPSEAPVHGAPVRQYINSKVTSVLLEGMKILAKEKPKEPLRFLGEFLLERSKELEGAGAATES